MRSYFHLIRHAGNRCLFRALEMSILSTLQGVPFHLHAEGLRGTGKTTILRAARGILPRIERIKGCLYNCDPLRPHCPDHRDLDPEEIRRLGSELVPMPFLEVSPAAKVGTLVGSIDLARIMDRTRPEAALLPGIIPQAHRGIILVDEVNRLADSAPEVVDVLLGVMGTKPGKIQIEETGLAVAELPVSASVWAASNPDEDPGPLEEIRRQLSDRFDVLVTTKRPSEPQAVQEILGSSPWGQYGAGSTGGDPDAVREPLPWEREVSHPPLWDEGLEELLVSVYLDFGLESLRALESWRQAAVLSAWVQGATTVAREHVMAVAPLVLRHRTSPEVLSRILEHLRGKLESREGPPDKVAAVAGGQRAGAGQATSGPGQVPWGRLFARLKSLVGSGHSEASRNLGSDEQVNPARGSGLSGGTTGQDGSGGEGDPARSGWPPENLPLTAPPRVARSLAELPGWEMVKPGGS